jgi:hypothetical protein
MYHDYIMCPPHFVLRLNKPVERNRWGRAGIEMRDIKNAILRVGLELGASGCVRAPDWRNSVPVNPAAHRLLFLNWYYYTPLSAKTSASATKLRKSHTKKQTPKYLPSVCESSPPNLGSATGLLGSWADIWEYTAERGSAGKRVL